MKPNTRLLIRFTLPNGDMKGWGYDAPYFKKLAQLQQSIVDDFVDWPDHTAIDLFYHDADQAIVATDNIDLAQQACDWLMANGASL